MCKYAKINYEKLEFVGNWYSTNTWTNKQQNAFRTWFVDTIYKDNKFRKGLYACMPKNKKTIRDAWSWFNLAYGFRIKERG